MNTKFKSGDIVYIIANGIYVKEARVVQVTKSTRTYTLKFTQESGGTRLPESRLHATREEAEFLASVKASYYEPPRQV